MRGMYYDVISHYPFISISERRVALSALRTDQHCNPMYFTEQGTDQQCIPLNVTEQGTNQHFILLYVTKQAQTGTVFN